MKKVCIVLGSLAFAVVVAAVIWFWNGFSKFMAMEEVKIDPLLTYYSGSGNSIVLTSQDGKSALVVDTKMRDAARKLRDAVTADDVTIVNTHSHSDHTAGNALYPKAKIVAGAYTKEQWEKDSDASRYPDITLKPGEEKRITIGSETAVVRNMGRAHTMNDVVVFLENRRILITGDLVFINMHPAVKTDSGASVANWIKALDDLKSKHAIQKLVPGHGPISNAGALDVQREYFISIGDATGNREKLAELKKKYDGYVALPAMTGFDRTARFIENEKKDFEKK